MSYDTETEAASTDQILDSAEAIEITDDDSEQVVALKIKRSDV